MIDYLEAIERESGLFLSALSPNLNPNPAGVKPVPACPDWNAADLLWHLTEVQYFWATMVGQELTNYEDAPRLERPVDDQLPALFEQQLAGLLSTLSTGADDEPCWSWHPTGGTRGWVRRRQAQEALIHRVDAEQTAAMDLSPIDETLAADGIDEMLTVMMGADPRRDRFVAGPDSLQLVIPGRQWGIRIGEVTIDDDSEALRAILADDQATTSDRHKATITGSATAIDLWLWRRAELPLDAVSGDTQVADQLHQLARID